MRANLLTPGWDGGGKEVLLEEFDSLPESMGRTKWEPGEKRGTGRITFAELPAEGSKGLRPQEAWKTGVLKPDTFYRVSVRYRMAQGLDSRENYAFLQVIDPDQSERWAPEVRLPPSSGEWREITYRLVTDHAVRPVLRLAAKGGGQLDLDAIRVAEFPESVSGGSEDSKRPLLGMCAHLDWLHFYQNDDEVLAALDLVQRLGASSIRFTIPWDKLEPEKGRENARLLQRIDFVVEEARKRGQFVLAVLGATPSWASRQPDNPNPWRFAAANPADYRDYVEFLAARFRGRIKHWEVGNEVNWEHSWEDEVEPYLEELRIASEVLRAADAENVMLCAGLAGAGLVGLPGSKPEYLDRLLEPGIARLYDKLAIHYYPIHSVREFRLAISGVTERLRAAGLSSKPIWITETGASLYDRKTEDSKTKMILEILNEAARLPGVEAVYLYNLREKTHQKPKQQGFGLVREDLTLGPAFEALATQANAGSGQ